MASLARKFGVMHNFPVIDIRLLLSSERFMPSELSAFGLEL